ncbi:replication associated protein [Microviridae sp.]|nr:replication associated protein [Microviridae sp.]
MSCTSPEAVCLFDGKMKFLGHKYFIKGTQTPMESSSTLFFAKLGVSCIPLPCGSCMGCRIAYSRDYALRGVCEAELSDYNYFVTLTYDDDHVPKTPSGQLTLRKSDVRSFLVRLRLVLGSGLRTLGCAEYGERTHRPHYHIIFFGKKIDDLVPYTMKGKNILYESETISRAWGHGRVLIGEANFTTIKYVAGYVTKKVKGKNAADYYGDREHESLVAVTRNGGGIGSHWFDRFFGDLLINGSIVSRGREWPIPRYFRLKLKTLYPDLYAVILEKMKKKACEKDRLEFTIERQTVKESVNKKTTKERDL